MSKDEVRFENRAGLAAVDFVGVGLNATDTVLQLPRFPEPEAKMEIASQWVALGGQVASAAVALSRWGWRARYVGKIGDDDAGRLHRAAFAEENVDANLVEVPGCPSQKSFILVDSSTGERTILWKRDPRLDIDPVELRREWIVSARLLHVDGHPGAPAIAAARWAKEAGTIVSSDLDNLYAGAEELLEYVDYEISSEAFPRRLTGVPDLRASLPQIQRRFGCRVVGATRGRNGVLAWDGRAFHQCPGFQVSAVDTTGAGDIFHAGLAHSLLMKWELPDALEFACAAAALNCTAVGARGGIRPLSEIEEFRRTAPRYEPVYSSTELDAAAREQAKPRAERG